jgi:hypothetical protein
VLYTALELSDKASAVAPDNVSFTVPVLPCPVSCLLSAALLSQICCSFGVDVLEALAASCTQLAATWDRRAAYNVACDALVASLLLLLHGATLMSQVSVLHNWA